METPGLFVWAALHYSSKTIRALLISREATTTGKQELSLLEEAERRTSKAADLRSRELNLSIEGLTTLPAFTDVPYLERLTLRGTRISNLSPLANLNALQALYLDVIPASNFAPLAGLTRLIEGARMSEGLGLSRSAFIIPKLARSIATFWTVGRLKHSHYELLWRL